jgi:non-homologous end joining protein Ku
MATMDGARGTKTMLRVGLIPPVPVILHGTVADSPKLKDYAVAGPNGRPLRYVQRAEAAPVEEVPEGQPVPVRHDAAGVTPTEDPGPELPPGTATVPATWDEASVPGRFRNVLIEEPPEGGSEDEQPEVTPEQVQRGLRLDDGTFVNLTKSLALIEQRTKLEQMEVIATLDYGQVPRERVIGSYYLAAESTDAAPIMRLIYEATRKVRRACVVKWTARTKQSLGILVPQPSTGALLVLKLAWAEDVREPGPKQLAHQQASVHDVEVDAMAELLLALGETRRTGLDVLRDDARELREELEAQARAGKPERFRMPMVQEAPREVPLTEMLEASVRALN